MIFMKVSPAGVVDGSSRVGNPLIKELPNSLVQSCEPQSGFRIMSKSSTGCGIDTRAICGTRERKCEILLRDIASAAVF